ncbi:MAG: hypothetical protein ACYC1S_15625 [Gemmatimonadaceae bacterium]
MPNFFQRRGLRALPTLAMAGALAVSAAGCNTDKLVQVEDPAALRPGDLQNAGSVPALVQGAFRQFVGGYSGFGDDAFLSASAVITDETYYGDTFTTREAADKRNTQPPILGNITDAAFSRLQQARFNARRAFAVVEQYTQPSTAKADSATRAQLRTIEGMVYVTSAEGWCGAVPFSKLPDAGDIDPTAIEFGESLNWNQMNDTAVARFNEALAYDKTNRLAMIAKGRALLNLGKPAEAAAAVAPVPTTYIFFIEHSPNTGAENNPITSLQLNGRYGVANLEGATGVRPDASVPVTTAASAEGIAFRGLQDPRVPYIKRGSNAACFSSSVLCWMNQNYPDFESDVPLATGIEARLIEAEAALAAGKPDEMLAKLNTLRASSTQLLAALYPRQKQTFLENGAPKALPPLALPATAAEQRALLFQERALWLYNTGHRLGDLRRLVRNYQQPSASVFPSGAHFRGGTYGNDVAYPVPFSEQNNPKFNPSACVTTEA